MNKYKNIECLEINDCKDISFLNENSNIKRLLLRENVDCDLLIKDWTPISKLDKLEILDIFTFTNISDISFLKNIKTLKELHLNFSGEKIIKDSSPKSYLEKLEILKIYYTFDNISF